MIKKVITAIFLKDTLDAAHNDAENLILDKMRKKVSSLCTALKGSIYGLGFRVVSAEKD